MFQRFEIGQFVTFTHKGSTIVGHIRVRTGSLFAIETAAHEVFHVPESDIAARVGEILAGNLFNAGAFPAEPAIWS